MGISKNRSRVLYPCDLKLLFIAIGHELIAVKVYLALSGFGSHFLILYLFGFFIRAGIDDLGKLGFGAFVIAG